MNSKHSTWTGEKALKSPWGSQVGLRMRFELRVEICQVAKWESRSLAPRRSVCRHRVRAGRRRKEAHLTNPEWRFHWKKEWERVTFHSYTSSAVQCWAYFLAQRRYLERVHLFAWYIVLLRNPNKSWLKNCQVGSYNNKIFTITMPVITNIYWVILCTKFLTESSFNPDTDPTRQVLHFPFQN